MERSAFAKPVRQILCQFKAISQECGLQKTGGVNRKCPSNFPKQLCPPPVYQSKRQKHAIVAKPFDEQRALYCSCRIQTLTVKNHLSRHYSRISESFVSVQQTHHSQPGSISKVQRFILCPDLRHTGHCP